MNTGHHDDDLAKFEWMPADPSRTLVASFLNLPVAHKPGTHFLYNTPASYVLAAAVQKLVSPVAGVRVGIGLQCLAKAQVAVRLLAHAAGRVDHEDRDVPVRRRNRHVAHHSTRHRRHSLRS